MQDIQLAELLSNEIQSMIRDQRIAAEVSVAPREGGQGPFVEVRPTSESDAPAMTIHVLDSDSLAVSVGETASADWTGSAESIVQTIRSLAGAMFQGNLQEEVTLSRTGEVVGSKLLMVTETGSKLLWRRSSLSGLYAFVSRSRELRKFPAYPLRS
jgi:hypothetical protein